MRKQILRRRPAQEGQRRLLARAIGFAGPPAAPVSRPTWQLGHLADAWRDGGYSEDFITLSFARYHGRTLAVPKASLFPNRVSNESARQFWNFLCRQIFVLTRT